MTLPPKGGRKKQPSGQRLLASPQADLGWNRWRHHFSCHMQAHVSLVLVRCLHHLMWGSVGWCQALYSVFLTFYLARHHPLPCLLTWGLATHYSLLCLMLALAALCSPLPCFPWSSAQMPLSILSFNLLAGPSTCFTLLARLGVALCLSSLCAGFGGYQCLPHLNQADPATAISSVLPPMWCSGMLDSVFSVLPLYGFIQPLPLSMELVVQAPLSCLARCRWENNNPHEGLQGLLMVKFGPACEVS